MAVAVPGGLAVWCSTPFGVFVGITCLRLHPHRSNNVLNAFWRLCRNHVTRPASRFSASSAQRLLASLSESLHLLQKSLTPYHVLNAFWRLCRNHKKRERAKSHSLSAQRLL